MQSDMYCTSLYTCENSILTRPVSPFSQTAVTLRVPSAGRNGWQNQTRALSAAVLRPTRNFRDLCLNRNLALAFRRCRSFALFLGIILALVDRRRKTRMRRSLKLFRMINLLITVYSRNTSSFYRFVLSQIDGKALAATN